MSLLVNTTIEPNRTRYFYNSIHGFFFEICSNPVYYEKLYAYGLVQRQTVDLASEIVRNMDLYSKEAQADGILRVGFEVGGNILNKLWLPSQSLTNQIDRFVREFFEGKFIIGIHLRFQYIKDPVDTHKMVECALGLEKNLTTKNKRVKWFVVSDSQLVLNRLADKYPGKIVLSSGKIGHVFKDVGAYSRAIMDVELLSRCDELVLTGRSTFGFVAAMKKLKMPYYLNGPEKMDRCDKMRLSRPSLSSGGAGVFK
jgi:hypothetical protein